MAPFDEGPGMVDARFVVSAAVEYAQRRGARLRAITIAVPHESAVDRIREELHAAVAVLSAHIFEDLAVVDALCFTALCIQILLKRVAHVVFENRREEFANGRVADDCVMFDLFV